MSSSDPALSHLDLSTDQPGVRFMVRDDFRAVAEGVNRLTTDLPPGLYQLDIRAGDVVRSEALALRPGDQHVRRIAPIPTPTIAPVTNSLTTRPDFMAAATQACAAVPGDAEGALVVVVCRPPGDATPDFPHHDTELLDGDLRPVAGWHDDWSKIGSAASWTRPLDPGGYVVRMTSTEEDEEEERLIDRPVWIERGWQTILFCIRHTTHRELSMVSVHMCRIDKPWRGDDPANAALETALTGLRHRRRLVSAAQVLEWLAGSGNPMLGIIAAHALRTGPHPDHDGYDAIVARLRDLTPSHPDVTALSMQSNGRLQPTGQRLAWPPMVAGGYCDLAVPASLQDEDVIVEGSVAEQIAGNIVVHGVWLAWMSLPRASGSPPMAFQVDLLNAPRYQSRGDIDVTGPAPEVAALRRVETFLDEVASVRDVPVAGVIRDWEVRDIAAATALPMRTVRQSVDLLTRRSR